MASLPLLTKRAYDARVLSVDVKPKLRAGDSVTSFSSVSAEVIKPRTAGALTVSVNSQESAGGKEWLHFNCSGGDAGASYKIALRYVSTTESRLESVIQVDVV